MELNFSTIKYQEHNTKIFTPQTTPCNIHPSFSMVTCEDVCPCLYSLEFCTAKLVDAMKENTFHDAMLDIMQRNELTVLTDVQVSMVKFSKHSYVPERITFLISFDISNPNSITVRINNVRTNGYSKCSDRQVVSNAINGIDSGWKLDYLEFTDTTTAKKTRDVNSSLWMTRVKLLQKWLDMKNAKKFGLPYQDDENDFNIFVVLKAMDPDQNAISICNGASNLVVADFGYSYETSEEIYQALFCNKICIIRVDEIDHPVAKGDYKAHVYTCVPVSVIQRDIEIICDDDDPTAKCMEPLNNALIGHMGEYKCITDIKLSWGFSTYIEDVVIAPNKANPLSPVELQIRLADVYGGLLNYKVTFNDNKIDVKNDIPRLEEFNYSNCGCR